MKKIFNLFKKGVGGILMFIAGVIYLIGALIAFIITISILFDAVGLIWTIILATFLMPATVLLAPIYAAFAWGIWLPLLIIYGGGLLMWILFLILGGLGSVMMDD